MPKCVCLVPFLTVSAKYWQIWCDLEMGLGVIQSRYKWC